MALAGNEVKAPKRVTSQPASEVYKKVEHASRQGVTGETGRLAIGHWATGTNLII